MLYDRDLYLSDNYITLDLETTNNEYGNPCFDNTILLAAYTHGRDGTPIVLDSPRRIMALAKAAEEADFIVAHNAKFEVKWLIQLGVDPHKIRVWCTQIGEYLQYTNLRMPLDLGSVAKRYGLPGKAPFVDICMNAGICPSELPKSLLVQRCVDDITVTREIFLKQRQKFIEHGHYLKQQQMRCLLTLVLSEMELQGMQLDPKKVEEEYYKACTKMAKLTDELDEMCGGINQNSGIQVAEYLYDVLGFEELKDRKGQPIRTATGRRKADAATIGALVAKTEEQDRYLTLKSEYAKVNAQLTKALEKFQACCEESGGRLYANFNQCVTATQRLSSSGVKYNAQFQNLAREFKPLFKAREGGYKFIEVDQPQLEFRVAAFLADDKQARYDILNGVDVHMRSRDVMAEAGLELTRTEAKSRTFKPLYGGEYGTKEEMAYYKWFKEHYSGIAETQGQWKDEVLNNKELTILNGVTWYFPGANVSRSGYMNVGNQVCNYPVQHFATGEIVPICLIALWDRLRKNNMKTRLVNTVHDSTEAEVPDNEVELFTEQAVKAYTTDVYEYLEVVYGIDFNIPLGAGVTVGSHWGEGDEQKFDDAHTWR